MKTLSLDELVKYTKYAIPISVPILYLQGIVYYQGKLNGFGIRYGFYPLPVEDALTEAFLFYLGTISYIFYFGLGWILLAFLITWFGTKVQQRKSTKFQKWIEILIEKIWKFITKNITNFLGPSVLFFAIYAIFVLGIAVVVPYFVGLHQNQSKLEKIIKEYPKHSDTIFINNGEVPVKREGIILQSTRDFVSFYANNSIFTYPCSRIEKIEHKVNQKPNHLLGKKR